MVKVREDIPIMPYDGDQIDRPHSNKTFNSNFVRIIPPADAKNKDAHVTIDTQTWLKRICTTMGVEQLPELEKACNLVAQVVATQHEQIDQKTTDVKPTNAYNTGIGTADIVSYLAKDETVLVSAVLFRAVRKNLLSLEEVAREFSEDVVKLVTDSLAMGRFSEIIENSKGVEDHFNNNQRDHLEGIYKLLISVTNDVRVVLIKLAERTFALRHLSTASTERQQRVAREIMTIYAPLAHRLGIAQLKWELEDLAFRYLAPERYKEIAKLLAEKRTEREDYINRMMSNLKQALACHDIEAEVFGRVKHIYSIYKKMKLKNLSFDQLYDIRALRVLVDRKVDCYHTLGIIHEIWRHIPDQFDDYITNPKPNGYRSLHTAVIAEKRSLEVQIRTHSMHFEAELGVCAHVNYKEGTKNRADTIFDNRLNSLRQVLENYQENNSGNSDPEDDNIQDWSELKRIYVFTKDGDINELPKGATVLDFAYYLHTQVGNKCTGAKVNQNFVPLTYTLKTGEKVEILTRKDREPKRDWLVASLGYMKTSRARHKLKHWFNQQDRGKNIQIGQDMLNRELIRLGLHPNSIDLGDYVSRFKVSNADDILVGLVKGDIQLDSITKHITKQLQIEPELEDFVLEPSISPKVTGKLDAYKVGVEGLDNIDISFAKCCNPVQGEPIFGIITRQKGVSIHTSECIELGRLLHKEPERGVSANWHSNVRVHQQVKIGIEAYDRRGLLKDLTQVIDKEGVNIVNMNINNKSDGFLFLTIHVEVTGLSQLSRLLAKLEHQPGIVSARRQQYS